MAIDLGPVVLLQTGRILGLSMPVLGIFDFIVAWPVLFLVSPHSPPGDASQA